MNNNKKLKAFALSLGLAALMAPATMNAQINRASGRTSTRTTSNKNRGMMNPKAPQRRMEIRVSTTATWRAVRPLGSGIAILIGAGLGYVALKKKEDEQ